MNINRSSKYHSFPRSARSLLVSLVLAAIPTAVSGQQLIYQEGFNTDGEAANPPRYTTTGRAAFEVDQHNNPDQSGPIYWAHNFEVSFVGVPAPTPGRRMLLAWDTNIDGNAVTEETWKLLEGAVKWMVNNKPNAVIIVSPSAFSLGALGDRLASAGYALYDDDPGIPDQNLHTAGDLYIHAPGTSNPSRGVRASLPVIAMNAPDHDDLLTSSIGLTANFQPGPVTITAPNHPAAGGLTGSFPLADTSANWHLMGDILPIGSTVLASFVRVTPPTITSLADVDAMIAGTKASAKVTESIQALDLFDGSGGNWFNDSYVPGGASGIWGVHARGKLRVTAPGTYSFALGTDDGGRLQIDINRNGFDASDTIITDLGPHGHQVSYGDATFTAAGVYDFQVIAYNSGGAGSVELAVAVTAGGNKRDLIALPEAWSNIGDPAAISAVRAEGNITVDAYVPSGDAELTTLPFIVLLNGPNDTPPGSVFGGGPFTGFEGRGFFAMSAGNKWPFPDGATHRTLTLRPVDVRGKSNLKLTVALAATFLDFERDDFLDIIVYPNGKPGTSVRLARFSAPSTTAKYFVDVDNGNTHQLGLEFKDVTYDIPAGATDLVVEFRAFTTWWNEIVAFDNVRITSGVAAQPINLTISSAAPYFNLNWTGGQGPFMVQAKLGLDQPWVDLATAIQRSHKGVILPSSAFFRIADQTTKNIATYHAILTGAAERPNPVTTPAKGIATVSIDLSAKTMTYLVFYENLTQPATAAHVHAPAGVDATAGVIVPLTAVGSLGVSGTFAATAVALTDAHLNAITNGLAYFNIHTSANTGGEIRGQIVPVP